MIYVVITATITIGYCCINNHFVEITFVVYRKYERMKELMTVLTETKVVEIAIYRKYIDKHKNQSDLMLK